MAFRALRVGVALQTRGVATSAPVLGMTKSKDTKSSGKTKIAALILDHLWRQNPGAKCVVVAQEVSLVLQQIEVLLRSCKPFKTDENGGKKGPSGGAFGSFNPVPNMTWPDLLKKYDIMVYTPQTLINLLDAKEMHGRQVLMCLDR